MSPMPVESLPLVQPPQISALKAQFQTLAELDSASSPAQFITLLNNIVSGSGTQSSTTGTGQVSSGQTQLPAVSTAQSALFAGPAEPAPIGQGQIPVSAPSTGSTGPLGAVANALSVLGTPYVWGGSSPSQGFDCSGLVKWAFGQAGIDLPRTAAEQQAAVQPVPSLAQAQPGDLVFYGDPAYHVGIYLGNGYMIDAPETGQTVQIAPVGNPTTIGAVNNFSGQGVISVPPALAQVFESASSTYGVPVSLLEAVAQVESGMNPAAVSSAGAEGMMQIMPQTAASLGINPFDPTQAIFGAAELLSQKISKFGSIPLALAAYNAGDGAVEKYGGIPPYQQTQSYVAKVLSLAGGSIG